MNIETLRIINFRCFDELSINFDRNLTIFVGDNGYGKTTILDAISIAISPFIGSFPQGRTEKIKPDDVRMTTDNLGQYEFHYPARFEVTGTIDGYRESWARHKQTPKGGTSIKEAKNLVEVARRLNQTSEVFSNSLLPVIRYYGICRLCREIRSAIPKQNPRKYAERTAGYLDCLESASGFDVFQRWFIAASHAVFQFEQSSLQNQQWDEARKNSGEHWRILRNSVRLAINEVLSRTGWSDLEYDATLQKLVMFHKDQGRLSVDQLSSGIKTMVGLVADLAYRAVKLNARLKENAIKEVGGIVLIDEIDLHLHPSWQQRILPDLMRTFPNIQFIVTTHSPQVLSTIPRENIRVIGKNRQGQTIAEPPLAMTYGEPSGDVMHSVMKVDPQPPIEEKQDLQRLTELVDTGQYESDVVGALMQKLMTRLGEHHPQLQRLQRSIRRQEVLKR